MEATVQEKLSLEAGAAHLTELLHHIAVLDSLPPALRQAVESADLSRLFTEQALKEDWKYTPMDPLRQRWSYVPAQEMTFPVEPEGGFTMIDSQGAFPFDLLPRPLSPWEALLNAAPVRRHYQLPEGARMGLALQTSEGLSAQLITATLSPHSHADIWLTTAGNGFTLLRLHLHIPEGARLRLYHSAAAAMGYHYLILTAHVERHGALETYTLSTGAGWYRHELRVRLAGTEAITHLHGAAHIPQGGVVDTAVRVEHAAPHTESNQLFKSLVEAGGRSAFQGRIYVDRVAQKTNAYQSHRALLTAPSAVAYSRPQLEIFADDVRCTHGVTTGFLQGDILFYLQARGISEATARQMLYRAFLAEVIAQIPDEQLRSWAEAHIAPSA